MLDNENVLNSEPSQGPPESSKMFTKVFTKPANPPTTTNTLEFDNDDFRKESNLTKDPPTFLNIAKKNSSLDKNSLKGSSSFKNQIESENMNHIEINNRMANKQNSKKETSSKFAPINIQN